VIALLGEYDALAGLSQQAHCAIRCRDAGANGHGCGHNLLGTAAGRRRRLPELAGAARRLRDDSFLRLSGEEGGSGKTFMVREGCLMTSMPR
jgi:aminobenzoyl-glutamate utilization protein B